MFVYNKMIEFLAVLILVLALPAIFASIMIPKKSDVIITESVQNVATSSSVRLEQIDVLTIDGEIVSMTMEDYITCVVLCEMPTSFEPEALKAQAIVARTYALRRMDSINKHSEADVCTDPACCQGFKTIDEHLDSGGSEGDIERINSAVAQTDGLVLFYGDEVAEATYFSCSGGMTEDAAAVWGSDIPYLQATLSPGEERSEYYINTEKFSYDDFEKRMGIDIEFESDWIGDITYTDGGGVDSIVICGKRFTGKEMRQKLGLRSTAFAIQLTGDKLLITTKGFGHRVGMSQYGAQAMALDGKSCDEILKYYYSGVEIKNGFS